MGISMTRLRALVKKEMLDLPKNMNVSVMCLLPIAIVLLFANLGGGDPGQGMRGIDLLRMGLNTNLVIVSTFAISMLIAEEKENNTLRTLMLSSVTPVEFLAGKAIVTLAFSVVTNTIIYFIAGFGLTHLAQYLLWSMVVTVVMMEIGGIIGLIAKNQMATSVLGLPVIFGFMTIPMMAQANETLGKIASLLPNHNLNDLLGKVMSGQGTTGISYHMFVIFTWIILATLAFVYTYHKKSLDR